METQSSNPKRFYILTYPRTASNLLMKILNLGNQPSLQQNSKSEYFFEKTLYWRLGPPSLGGKALSKWSEDEKSGLRGTFEKCVGELEDVCERAKKEGKDIIVKEHVNWILNPVAEGKWAFGDEEGGEEEWMVDSVGKSRSAGNDTVLSDEFLNTWSPTFLIRHPALVFPSNYRTLFDLHGAEAAKNEAYHAIEMTMHWSRTLYDWFTTQPTSSSSQPIILDADDVMLNADLVRCYSQILGLDPSKLRFEWTPTSKEELEKMGRAKRRMVSTISASGGVVEGKTGMCIDIDVEAGKWKEEFGEDEGVRIESWVRNAMDDYEYMRERRFL